MQPDVDPEKKITYFGVTHTRGRKQMFGIRAQDRGMHMYVIGKTGMGKSTMLENMAIQDIQNGEGIAFVDPHGSSAEKLLDFIPQERMKDVLYFAPFDTDFPVGFNIMEDVGYDHRHRVVSGLMGVFKRIWEDAWSARMEYILQNTLFALLEYPESTLVDVNRMLVNKEFRKAVIEKITDPVVKSFWQDEFANYSDRYTQDATPAIQNKIGQFVSNPLIRNIISQPKSSFDIRKMMDEKKIFIANLSKGRMGEQNTTLLGSMLTVKIYLAAMSRADESAARLKVLPRFYFYVDEFQSMMNEAFANILSESRKYKLALTLANQYVEQMEENVRNAVFGNIGTTVCFRVGPFDAQVLSTIFEPTFVAEDLVNLGRGQIYLTLMIDGVGSLPFSGETIPPIEAPTPSYRDEVIEYSRHTYGVPRIEAETFVNKRQGEFPMVQKPKDASARGGGFRPAERREERPVRTPADVMREHKPRPVPESVLDAEEARAGQSPQDAKMAVERIREERSAPEAPRPPARDRAEREDRHVSSARREAELKERNSLKAAIEAAKRTAAQLQKTETSREAPRPVMQPKRMVPPGENAETRSTPNTTPRNERPRFVPTAAPIRTHDFSPRPPASKENNGEVSPELLSRVLNGQ